MVPPWGLFSTVALENGDPILNENDLTTIDSVKAVTYGSTIGQSRCF